MPRPNTDSPFGTRWHPDAEWEIPSAIKRYAIVSADGVPLKWAMSRGALEGSVLLEGNGVRVVKMRSWENGTEE